jgi:hypothetical protein
MFKACKNYQSFTGKLPVIYRKVRLLILAVIFWTLHWTQYPIPHILNLQVFIHKTTFSGKFIILFNYTLDHQMASSSDTVDY